MAQINSGVADTAYSYRQPSFTYKFSETNIDGKTDGQKAVKQAIKHILMSERYESAIYDDGYGIELAQYVGKGYGYLRAGIEETLREALLQDDRITEVFVTDVRDMGEGACSVTFTVSTIYGEIENSIDVNV